MHVTVTADAIADRAQDDRRVRVVSQISRKLSRFHEWIDLAR